MFSSQCRGVNEESATVRHYGLMRVCCPKRGENLFDVRSNAMLNVILLVE